MPPGCAQHLGTRWEMDRGHMHQLGLRAQGSNSALYLRVSLTHRPCSLD